jgi:glycosyltransferase involved in cell wall biosynthesis
MNILFLSRDYPPNQIGGVGIYAYEASRLLAKLGHRVFVITEAIGHPLEYLDQGVHIFRVKPRKYPIFNPIRERLKYFTERLEYSYTVSKKIQDVISRYNIDIIESSEARAEGFWYYFLRNKPPLVIKLHTPEGIVYKLNRQPITKEWQLIEYLEEWWISRAHRLIGLSKSVVKLTQTHYRIRFNNIPIVSNPIDINLFKPANFLNNKGYILYVGRLEYRKGVHVLLRAIPSILKKFPQVKFIFIGSDCGMKDYLLGKIAGYGIKDFIEFIDQISRRDLISYYQQSTLCVVPSLWENHPYVILEAMACGKPVIATDVGGIPEIIKDRINGILVPPGSVLSLADSITELLSDKKLQEILGTNARKFIEDQYAPERVIQRTLNIYKELKN